jgi:hypothetical protein
MKDLRTEEIVKECKRQEQSCLYTSTALFSWLDEVRVWRIVFIVLPIIAGTVASAKILLKNSDYDWITAIAALLAGLFPAIFKALDLDVSLKNISDSANRFKSLQDRFRQASSIGAGGVPEALEEDFKTLMNRMDEVRSASPPIPERHFKNAQKKIRKGDYTFDSTSGTAT